MGATLAAYHGKYKTPQTSLKSILPLETSVEVEFPGLRSKTAPRSYTNTKKEKTECLKELCQIIFQVAPTLLSVCRVVAKSVKRIWLTQRQRDTQPTEPLANPNHSQSEWSLHSNTQQPLASIVPLSQPEILKLLAIVFSILISQTLGISPMVMTLTVAFIISTQYLNRSSK